MYLNKKNYTMRKIAFLGVFALIFLGISGCALFQNQLGLLLGSAKPQTKQIIPHPFEQPPKFRVFYAKYDTLLHYISLKEVMGKWRLKRLHFDGDTSSAGPKQIHLHALYESRSRYNSKYEPLKRRHRLEWRKTGEMWGKKLLKVIQKLDQDSIFIKLTVVVKVKNYLRPNQILKPDTLRFNLGPEYLSLASQNPQAAYRAILQRYAR